MTTTPKQINRRQLIQQLTAITLGSTLLPVNGWAETAAAATTGSGGIYIAPGEGKQARAGDMSICFKLNKSQTDDHLGLWETVIQPGELGAPPHLHQGFDELLRVLEGSVHVMVGDEVTEVKAGGWHLRPRGLVHTFWNSGTVPAKTIDMSLPGGHEAYMLELSSLFENGHRPKPADLAALEKKYDILYRFDKLQEVMTTYHVHL